MNALKTKAFNILLIRAIKIGQNVLTFFILASLISKSEFGYYAFNYSLSLSMIVISYFGSEQYGLKKLAKSHLFVGRLITLKAIFSIPTLFTYIILSFNLTPVVDYYFVICISLYLLLNYELLSFNYFNSIHRLDVLAKNIIFSFLITSTLKVYSYLNDNVEFFFLSILLDSLIPFLFFFFYALKSKSLSLKFQAIIKVKVFFHRHKNKLFFLFLATFFVQLNTRIDSYFVSHFLGGEQLSVYSISLKFNEVFAVIVSSTIALYAPVFYRAKKKIELVSVTRRIILSIIFLYLSASIILFLTFDVINNIFLMGEYNDSKNIIFILYSGTLFGGISSIISMWYIYSGKESSKTKRVFVSLIINIVLSFVFIPKLGVIGAAIVSFMVNVTLAIILNLNVKELREFFHAVFIKE